MNSQVLQGRIGKLEYRMDQTLSLPFSQAQGHRIKGQKIATVHGLFSRLVIGGTDLSLGK